MEKWIDFDGIVDFIEMLICILFTLYFAKLGDVGLTMVGCTYLLIIKLDRIEKKMQKWHK